MVLQFNLLLEGAFFIISLILPHLHAFSEINQSTNVKLWGATPRNMNYNAPFLFKPIYDHNLLFIH